MSPLTVSLSSLRKTLCRSTRYDMDVREVREGLYSVGTPFTFGDGDSFPVYLQAGTEGRFRITDLGHTWMHLSYDNEINKFRNGTRGKLLLQVLTSAGLCEEDGELFTECSEDALGPAVLRFGQALTRVTDLTFLNQARAEQTFYEDVKESLVRIVPFESIQSNFIVEAIENAEDYPVDFMIPGGKVPLFIFAVPGRDKARLTTLILERFLRFGIDFESVTVFRDQQEITRKDLARLTNVAGEMVASLEAEDDLRRKVTKRLANF